MGTKLEQGILGTLDRLYRVAQDGAYGGWSGIYSDMAEMLGAGPGGLTIFWSQSGGLKNDNTDFSVIATNMDPDPLKQYKDHFQYVSPFKEKIAALRAGESFSRRSACLDRDYERSELYNDLFSKLGIFEYEYHALYSDAKLNGGINFSRPKSRPEFSKNERQALDVLLPHIRRAFELQQKFMNSSKNSACMVDILDRLDEGVVIVDRSARVIQANVAAEDVFSKCDGLELRDRTVNATRASENQLFKRMLKVIFSDDINEKGLSALDMTISRSSGLRPLHLSLFHFNHDEVDTESHNGLAIVFIHDPEKTQHTSEEVLIASYGMTPAEARLSSILSDGISVIEASDILNIQPNTVRTHLKNIYSKTQTSRQSELIRLILKGPASLLRSSTGK